MRAWFLVLAVAALGGAGATAEASWLQKDRAILRALDKITGRSTDIEVFVDQPVEFGALEVSLSVCYQTPPELPPESAAFLQIRPAEPATGEQVDAAPAGGGATAEPLFSGWMFASSPGLSALEHPVYDVWVIECETPEVDPGASSSRSEATEMR